MEHWRYSSRCTSDLQGNALARRVCASYGLQNNGMVIENCVPMSNYLTVVSVNMIPIGRGGRTHHSLPLVPPALLLLSFLKMGRRCSPGKESNTLMPFLSQCLTRSPDMSAHAVNSIRLPGVAPPNICLVLLACASASLWHATLLHCKHSTVLVSTSLHLMHVCASSRLGSARSLMAET